LPVPEEKTEILIRQNATTAVLLVKTQMTCTIY